MKRKQFHQPEIVLKMGSSSSKMESVLSWDNIPHFSLTLAVSLTWPHTSTKLSSNPQVVSMIPCSLSVIQALSFGECGDEQLSSFFTKILSPDRDFSLILSLSNGSFFCGMWIPYSFLGLDFPVLFSSANKKKQTCTKVKWLYVST